MDRMSTREPGKRGRSTGWGDRQEYRAVREKTSSSVQFTALWSLFTETERRQGFGGLCGGQSWVPSNGHLGGSVPVLLTGAQQAAETE